MISVSCSGYNCMVKLDWSACDVNTLQMETTSASSCMRNRRANGGWVWLQIRLRESNAAPAPFPAPSIMSQLFQLRLSPGKMLGSYASSSGLRLRSRSLRLRKHMQKRCWPWAVPAWDKVKQRRTKLGYGHGRPTAWAIETMWPSGQG